MRQAIDPFVVNPDFEAKQIEKASKACTAICLWVRAMHKYNTVAKQVEPKRKLLAEKQVHGQAGHGSCSTMHCRSMHAQIKFGVTQTVVLLNLSPIVGLT